MFFDNFSYIHFLKKTAKIDGKNETFLTFLLYHVVTSRNVVTIFSAVEEERNEKNKKAPFVFRPTREKDKECRRRRVFDRAKKNC